MSKIRFFEVAGRTPPLIPPEGGRRSSTKKAQRIGYGTFPSFGGGRGGLILVLTIVLAGVSLGVNAQEYCDTQKFKVIKTNYGNFDGNRFYTIGNLDSAVINIDTSSGFYPETVVVNISNDTFPANEQYVMIMDFLAYADTGLLGYGSTQQPYGINKEFFSNDTVKVAFSSVIDVLGLINWLKENRNIEFAQISYWKMVAGICYTNKDGNYSEKVFFAGADTSTFRIVRGGVGIVETDNYPSLRVYPNPTNGQLTIDNGQLTMDNVEIYSIVGQRLTLTTLTSLETLKSLGRVTIDISHLPSGIYFLKINNQVTKFVKK